MVTSSSGPGAPGTFNLSIPCSDLFHVLTTTDRLVSLARTALFVTTTEEQVDLLLRLAQSGIAVAIRHAAAAERMDKETKKAPASAEDVGFTLDKYLVRLDLAELERAEYLAQQKAAYESQHPETKTGGVRGNQHSGGKRRSTGVPAFRTVAAEQLDYDQATVARLVRIGSKLSAAIRKRIIGTWLADNQTQLMALVRVPSRARAAVLDLLLDEASGVKTVAAALRRLTGGEG